MYLAEASNFGQCLKCLLLLQCALSEIMSGVQKDAALLKKNLFQSLKIDKD